eukprot:s234_g2.t1
MQGRDERYRDVCLINVLRAHGYKCEYTADGPFWAMEDGNVFLKPFRYLDCHRSFDNVLREWSHLHTFHLCCGVMARQSISRTSWQEISTMDNGQFIMTLGDHFLALRKIEGILEINHGNKRHEWKSAVIDPRACSGFFIIQARCVGR